MGITPQINAIQEKIIFAVQKIDELQDAVLKGLLTSAQAKTQAQGIITYLQIQVTALQGLVNALP